MDGRTDVYALACSAFEMLSGEPPFRRDEGLAVMYAQLSDPPPPLTGTRRICPRRWTRSWPGRWPSPRTTGTPPAGSSPRRCAACSGCGRWSPRPAACAAGADPDRHADVAASPAVRASAGGDTAAAQGQGPGSAGPVYGGDIPAGYSQPSSGPSSRPDSDAGPATQAARVPPAADPAGPDRAGTVRPDRPGNVCPVPDGRPRRPWYRGRGFLAAAAAIVVLAVVGVFVALRSGGGGSGSGGGGGGGGGTPVAAVAPPCAAPRPLRRSRSPACTARA